MTLQNPQSLKSDLSLSNHPFIWGNIALITSVPWLLALSMAGLAVGDPVFPEWFEIFILGFPAIALVALVQWQQPISPFSLWFVVKPSESLSDRERQILTLVKQHSNGWYVTGWIATAVAIVMSAIFCKIYISAPLAQAIAPFPAGLRLFGILWAEIFFLLSNVILQAGISALRIKLTAESELNGLKPFAPEKIKSSFTSVGWQSPQMLKFFEEDAAIAQVSDEALKVEVAEPSGFVAEVAPEAVSEINALVADTVCESDAIADTTEELITSPLEFVEDSEVEESLDSLESSEIIAESEIEAIAHEEIIQEPIEFLSSPEIETLDITDTSSEPELELETNTEVTDVSLDNDFVEEVEELEISAIVAEESLIETISDPAIEQFFEEPRIETILNQEIVQEPEELNPFELVEDEKSDIGAVLDSTENEPILDEEIDEESEKSEGLEAFDTLEEPELTFLEIPNVSSEPKTEETEQAEASLELADAVLEEQFTENSEELESLETIEASDSEEVLNPTLTSDNKRSLDFVKKSRKTGGSQKKQGFGKSIKRDVVSSPDTIEPNLEAIATPIEQDLEATEIKTQDFDDELDELIAFNAYVENILREYLEDNDEESKNAESLDEEPPKNLPDLETQVSTDITEEISSNEQSPQDSEYLVQELLVDKFLARIEELNIADKANKAAIESFTEDISNPNLEIDEFADLEALLDRKPEIPDPNDLSDRNS